MALKLSDISEGRIAKNLQAAQQSKSSLYPQQVRLQQLICMTELTF